MNKPSVIARGHHSKFEQFQFKGHILVNAGFSATDLDTTPGNNCVEAIVEIGDGGISQLKRC